MPYIKQEDREHIENGGTPRDSGELNYAIHLIIQSYWKLKGERYATYNDIKGALSCIGDELARRRIAPYEDKKIEENGDIEFYRP